MWYHCWASPFCDSSASVHHVFVDKLSAEISCFDKRHAAFFYSITMHILPFPISLYIMVGDAQMP